MYSFGSAMKNTDVLIVFFGILGLLCLILPKLIHVLYSEIINLGSGSADIVGGNEASSTRLNSIRILGIGILLVLATVYYF